MEGRRVRTVDRIVEVSIQLFNADGISQASLRGIAEEVGISHGNLAYHFANKSKILDEIYARMESEMDAAKFPEGDVTLQHYNALLRPRSQRPGETRTGAWPVPLAVPFDLGNVHVLAAAQEDSW
jgi:AcrR family transcriptional regulator